MPIPYPAPITPNELGLTVATRLSRIPPGPPLDPVTTSLGRQVIDSFKTPLPKRIDSSFAWVGKGPDGLESRRERWTRYVTDEDVEELERAAAEFIESGKNLGELTQEDFKIPNFAKTLTTIANKVNNELGVFLLRGLPVKKWSREQSAVVLLGIGSYVGDRVPQNKKGHVLGHVKDLRVDPKAPSTRRYMTNARQGFHTDHCDAVALMCLETAPGGGESLVASSTTVYNILQERYPELVPVLFAPWYWDRKNEDLPGQTPYFVAPPYTWHAGRLLSFCIPYFATTTERHDGVPPLTPEQVEVLKRLEEIAEEVAVEMSLEAGDIQFVNNHPIFHDRLAWRDTPDQIRHLLRLWLSTGGRGGWDLPSDGQNVRLGFVGAEPSVPLEAEIGQ
ncbi:Clavaminate synthase-like protein [Gonapodya prolifera JEL478]|uniref:Clavaminate synthase-like protein n=1 Tax=Gonapodya prolifera (strain JEL478) TaxID=1344416 RepID=A0A139A355_GONPJ|nr:Clavaminate synthase-like protein [Gonapodya prolifera JEL478]|eukprot:KXS11190.1 Clavaminate synthase-like protein [Gonapodya prolifera JEL478]